MTMTGGRPCPHPCHRAGTAGSPRCAWPSSERCSRRPPHGPRTAVCRGAYRLGHQVVLPELCHRAHRAGELLADGRRGHRRRKQLPLPLRDGHLRRRHRHLRRVLLRRGPLRRPPDGRRHLPARPHHQPPHRPCLRLHRNALRGRHRQGEGHRDGHDVRSGALRHPLPRRDQHEGRRRRGRPQQPPRHPHRPGREVLRRVLRPAPHSTR